MSTPLERDPKNGMIAGVCAGIATKYGMSSNLVRLLFLIFVLGPHTIIYFLLWFLMPVKATSIEMDDPPGKDDSDERSLQG